MSGSCLRGVGMALGQFLIALKRRSASFWASARKRSAASGWLRASMAKRVSLSMKALMGWLGAAESSLKGLAAGAARRGSKRNRGQWPVFTAMSCWRWL
jgi:hypothetical protein